jgi:hypothetical protein
MRNMQQSSNDEEYYAVPVIPFIPYDDEDYLEHNEGGFCDDMPHECHENPDSIADLNQAIQDGLITTHDADTIYRGKTI